MYKKTLLSLVSLFLIAACNATSIRWGTYFGGLLRDYGNAVAVDRSGNLYVVGSTSSDSSIATFGSHQPDYGGDNGSGTSAGDGFIAKYNPAGALLWSTYYGGTGDDAITGIAFDSSGQFYICGWTNSSNGIATPGGQQTVYGGGDDAFLAKFDSSGHRLWGTYVGGSGDENAILSGGIYVEPAGNVYLTGKTNSPNNIATMGSHQPLLLGGINDGYLIKFSPLGLRIWGTYFGHSTGGNATSSAAVYGVGSKIYITGATNCTTGIATSGTFQTTYGGGVNDGFLAQFENTGTLNWCTYIGGELEDKASAIICNATGIYISGTTSSSLNMSSPGSHQNTFGGNQDVFISSFNATGQRNWSSYYGGATLDLSGAYMAMDETGNVYITGSTTSITDIASPGAIKSSNSGNRDAFVAKFTTAGTRLWGSYFGGAGQDNGYGLAYAKGYLYLAGRTLSATNISTIGSQQPLLGGENDAFLISINDCNIPSKPDTITGDLMVCAKVNKVYKLPPVAAAVFYTWLLPSGWSGSSTSDSIVIAIGSASGYLKVIANGICNSSDTQQIFISVNAIPKITPSTPVICSGDSLLLTVIPASGSISWLKDTVTIGNTSQVYVRSAGNYSVITQNGTCRDTAKAILTVFPIPVVPGIIATGHVLSLSRNYSGYQWKFNGNPIIGAINPTYAYSIDGSYSVTVTDSNGCEASSLPFNTLTNGISGNNRPTAQIYPNLILNQILFIDAPFESQYTIAGMDGRIARKSNIQKGHNQVDLQGLASGIYLILVRDNIGTLACYSKISIQ